MLAGLLFVSVIVDYLFGLAVEGSLKRDKSRAVVFLVLDLIMNAALVVFVAHNGQFPEGSGLRLNSLMLPVGTAFYALKNFSYVYDVFSGRCKAERSPFYFITYGMSYPFMLAGPVVRYGDIEPQLRNRKLTAELMSRGVKSFAFGFIKTVIAVPVFGNIADKGLYSENAGGIGSLIGMLAWFLAAWFAFTGMSDMGTGIACLNGFDVQVNYRRLNAKHMLGGAVKCYNTSMVQLIEDIRGDGAAAAVLTVILAVCGAAFYSIKVVYLAVGLIAGVILACEYLFAYDRIERIPAPVKAVVTFIVAFVLFSPLAFDSFGGWTGWLSGISGPGGDEAMTLVKGNLLIIVICFVVISPLGEVVKNAADGIAKRSRSSYTAVKVFEALATAAALAVSYILLAAGTAAA